MCVCGVRLSFSENGAQIRVQRRKPSPGEVLVLISVRFALRRGGVHRGRGLELSSII